MKAIMVMFDTLNRHMLPPYGCDWTHAPNFARLAQRTVTFDRSYVGSMPCMPARRELHTGRYNFLHRSWGPLEPFDDSMPELLGETRACTRTWSPTTITTSRTAARPITSVTIAGSSRAARKATPGSARWPSRRSPRRWTTRASSARTGAMTGSTVPSCARKSCSRRRRLSRWARSSCGAITKRTTGSCSSKLSTRTSPSSPRSITRRSIRIAMTGPHFDWPNYGVVQETPEQVEHMRMEYAALLSMCDHYLGKVLDLMDELESVGGHAADRQHRPRLHAE